MRKRKLLPCAFLLATAASAQGSAPTAITAESVQEKLDLLWVLISAALVFFMQAGFLAFEVGAVRSKNTAITALKNVGDWVIISMMYYLVGYGMMFGTSKLGLVGASFFAGSGITDAKSGVFFLFQLAFAGTAATIVSGALESSNVDIAEELTTMIESQRTYTANSKTFQTGSELMDVLINLKR